MSRDGALALATGQPAPTQTLAGSPGLQPAAEPAAAPAKLESERFAALARRETDLVKRQQLAKQEREAFEKERETFRPIADQYKQYQEMKVKDPVAALKLMGFSETDIINYLANESKPEPTAEERAVKAATEATEARIQAYEEAQAKKQSDEQKARDATTIQGFKSQIGGLIKADPIKFEYCAHYGPAAEELAYEFTKAVVLESKGTEIITAQEAIEMVEEYYEEQDKAMSALKKRQPKETPAVAPPDTAERTRTVTPGFPGEKQPPAPITRSRELSNGSTSPNSLRGRAGETRAEKKERLAEMLRQGIKP